MEHIHPHHATRRIVASGFTLIELVVVFLIIVIITTITLTSQGSFNKTLILANTAYDIALSFRSAETYGIGSRVAGIVRNAGYGLHFDRAAPSNFTLFADINSPADGCHTLPPSAQGGAGAPSAMPGNCTYDGSGERVTDYALNNRMTISDFCAFSGSWSCANSHDYLLSSLDVVFARPNPDPFIYGKNVNNVTVGPFTAACIAVTSPQGGLRYISVAASGAITANATSCP